MSDYLVLHNGEAAPQAQVPTLSYEALRDGLIAGVTAGCRVLALFATPMAGGHLLWLVLGCPTEGGFRLSRAAIAGDNYPSLTPAVPAVHLFERELAEQRGLVPEGHPWLKPVRFPGPRQGRGDRPQVGEMDFYRVGGDEVHEVAVGPVHAGIIEPGHFRFQCSGEQVLNLEISLGYAHRGVERSLVGGPTPRTLPVIETLAGDTTIAHTTAYALAIEGLTCTAAPPRAQAIRAVALELERLANHTGDLGALAEDVAFLPTASWCGRIRGDWLNLSAQICGSRFGRGLVLPGGVRFDLEPARAAAMGAKVAATFRDVQGATKLMWDTPGVMARFEETGHVSRERALEVGLVGPAARASGLSRDARVDFPWDLYRFEQLPLASCTRGDVFGRAWVRWLEVQRSAAFVQEQLAHPPEEGSLRRLPGPLPPDRVVVTVVEAWRGELCHVALTDSAGRFSTYKIADPSFHNWTGLSLALRGQQISDFPLCNKSFNLSYCGFDL
ncbi:MAG: hydrogenase [Deltaproteobacteria bacterium]|nr:hydrogenase [Deltaproteobacteria bacterium]